MMRHALKGAQINHIDIPRLLRKCDITEHQLNEIEGRLPLEKVVKLLRHCNGLMNDEINGLLEKPVRVGSFEALALNAIHARTLGQALERSIRFYNLFENSFHYELNITKRQAEIVLTRLPEQSVVDNYAISSILTVLHRFTGWLSNDRILLNQVKLDYSPPAYRDEYQYMFYGAPVLFNQAHNSLSFDRHYLDHPVVQTESSLESYLRRAPMDLFLPVDAGEKWTMEVRTRLKDSFASDSKLLQLDQLAVELHINPQTLRRRLKAEGSSFDAIKSQLKRDIAINHLGNTQYSIETVAEACGYTEPSSFIRAFKAWTGFTPLQFRKGLDL